MTPAKTKRKRNKVESMVQRCAWHKPNIQGYIQWHEWAEDKGKTHRQIRCKGCDLFTIWVPKLRVVASKRSP